MKLKFLGTRANTEERSRIHYRHSSLLVTWRQTEVMIDCGEDWEGEPEKLEVDFIVLTHAHPDHAWGLRSGTSLPVFATEATWSDLHTFPIERKYTVTLKDPFTIGDITFEAFPVDHSTRCPAVGYRITAGPYSIFYVPDVVYIPDRESALRDIDLYIGDGATVTRSMVRKAGDSLVGHTPIRTQVGWCQKSGVPRALFTHCGTEIIKAERERIEQQIKILGQEKGVDASIAYDGLEIVLP
ncbi:MAG TPA: MBL fold metallo-hydrolase [Acidobacteriota bacterium]|nr:MBL fold metallo-hydrolase [Acidobacteriota bacterium]